MSTKRTVLAAAGAVMLAIILAAFCVPLLIRDRNTANQKALLKNLAEAKTNETAGPLAESTTHAPSQSSPANPGIPSETTGGVHIGTKDKEAISLMRPGSLDWGRVYWGGSGASQLYFQINTTQQARFEVSGF